jgi:hypothetical protein
MRRDLRRAPASDRRVRDFAVPPDPAHLHPCLVDLADAQRDMRFGYLGGAPGLLASALVWLAAGLAAGGGSAPRAVLTLFAGGTLIHPAAVLLSRALGRPGAHTPGNPLGRLALETTGLLLCGLAVAYAVALARAEWFFPAVLLVIGGRYLTFATLYGLRLYWGCGAALALAGGTLAAARAPLAVGAFAGAFLELAFAALVFAAVRRDGPASA